MRRILQKIRESIWLYPTIYSCLALILSIGITIIDKKYFFDKSPIFNSYLYTTLPLAHTVLSIVAGAFITIATFTFSTTMVVLTLYSTQFTPRVVENFLNDKTTMKSFGVFLSGFIYAITSLLFIKTSDDKNLVIAASVGVIYVIVGFIYFLVFIQSVSNHIQVSDLTQRLFQEASEEITHYCKAVEDWEVVSVTMLEKIINQRNSVPVTSHSDGYIQEIDYERLKRIAQNDPCIILFEKVAGQFVSAETQIFTVYYGEEKEFDEEAQTAMLDCILIGHKKTQEQDFSFTIQKLTEIAIKALSSSVNDPNTAVYCLKMIGLLLRDLAHIRQGYVVMKDEGEPGFIIYEAYDFKVLLYNAYHQILFYGESDPAILIAGLRSLRFVKAKASPENTAIIDEYAKHLLDKKANMQYNPLEYEKVEAAYMELAAMQSTAKKEEDPEKAQKE